MLFFGAIMAPLVFTQLPLPIAGPFIRTTFPFYYAFMIISATLAACGVLLRRETISAIILFTLIILTYWLWFWLIPKLDAMRADGNTAGFATGHTLSMWLNAAEFLSALALLVRLAVSK
jgi:hypothetical protein